MKKSLRLTAVALIAVLMLTMSANVFATNVKPSAACDPKEYQTFNFYIKNKNSGKYLDVSGGKATGSANVIQWAFSGKTNQQWKINEQYDGSFKIQSALNQKHVLSTNGSNNGGNISLTNNYQKFDNYQTFKIVKTSGNYFKLESTLNGKSVGVKSSSKSNGANIVQWDFGKNGNDQWLFERVTEKSSVSKSKKETVTSKRNPSSPVQNQENIFYIRNRNSNRYLTVKDGKAASGTDVIQSTFTGEKNQQWRFIAFDTTTEIGRDRRYLVSQLGDGKTYAIDVTGGNTKSGTNIQISKWKKGNTNQELRVQRANGSSLDDLKYRQLLTKTSNYTKLLSATAINDGNSVKQKDETTSTNASWAFEEKEATPGWTGIGNKNELDDLVEFGFYYAKSKNFTLLTEKSGSYSAPISVGSTNIMSMNPKLSGAKDYMLYQIDIIKKYQTHGSSAVYIYYKQIENSNALRGAKEPEYQVYATY